MYFLITVCGAGVRVNQYEKDDVLQGLEDHGLDPHDLRRSVGDEADPNYWGSLRAVLIKGEVVIPKVITTVTEYEVP